MMTYVPGDCFEKDGFSYYMKNYRLAVIYRCENDAETVIVPEKVEEYHVAVEEPVFEDLPNLRHLIFEPGVQIVRRILDMSESFCPVRNCPNLETVTLPDWFDAEGEELHPEGCPAFKGYIARPESENYFSENGCLYHKKEDGTTELVHCADPKERMRLAREMVEEMTDEELEELAENCIALLDQIEL